MKEFYPLKGFEDRYEISKDGTIKGRSGNIITKRFQKNKNCYRVRLYTNNGRVSRTLRVLLAETFIPNPKNYSCVVCKDGDRKNVNLSNLQWAPNYEKGAKRKASLIEPGTKFNLLTLIEDLGSFTNKGKKSRRGLFKCECGNTKEIDINSVKNSKTKSCGCLKNNKKSNIGEKYNKLEVIADAPNHISDSGNVYKRCVFKCDCGTVKTVRYKDVKRGKTKSCGCLSKQIKIDISKENIYGKLTIQKEVSPYISPKGNKTRRVLAKCTCGTEKEYNLNTLRSGVIKDCGCSFRSTLKPKKKYDTFKPIESTEDEIWVQCFSTDMLYLSSKGRAYSCYKESIIGKKSIMRAANKTGNCPYSNVNDVFFASFFKIFDNKEYSAIMFEEEKFNLESLCLVQNTHEGVPWVSKLFNYTIASRKTNKKFKNIVEKEEELIDKKYIYETYLKQEGLSYFLKIPLDLTFKNKLTAPSIDRIDNSKGYVKGNINIVTRFENMGRGNAEASEFDEFCNTLFENSF